MTISNLYLSRLHFLDKPKFLYWIYWKLEKMYLYVKTLKKYKNQDSVSILNFRKVIHIQMFEMITSDERFTVAGCSESIHFIGYFATCICNLSKATIKNNVGYKQQVYRKTLQPELLLNSPGELPLHNHCHYLHPSIRNQLQIRLLCNKRLSYRLQLS